MNHNWPRWIFASVTKHFSDTLSLKCFVEGEIRTTWADKDFVEIRMDGPYFKQLSRTDWSTFIEVNVLVQATIDNVNTHKIHSNVGLVCAAFTPISLYQYGDDSVQFGCLQPVTHSRSNQTLVVSHFGKVNPDKNLQQATVEGHYLTTLTFEED